MVASMKVLIGVCAYNEENNIGTLLQNLITKQNLPKASKILVVCSGCTDRTPEIVKNFKKVDERIELIIEKDRMGKAHALNKLFAISRRSADVLVLTNADASPSHGSIMKLLSKLAKSNAGAVFAQPVPLNGFDVLSDRIVHVIWRLHHVISLLQKPKLSGELCAIYTRFLQEIPENVATDEPYIELAIREYGSDILYVPEAIVHIRCPNNAVDLLKHRKRIWIGHLQIQSITEFKVSTSSFMNILRSFSALKPNEILSAFLGGFLELIAYLAARFDFSRNAVPYVWEPIKSTKTSIST